MLFSTPHNLLRSLIERSRYLATPAAGLSALGLASALLYGLGITARYPLVEGVQRPRAVWSTLVHYSLRAGLLHAAIYLLLVAAYMLALRLALRRDIRHQRGTIVVVGVWLLCSAILLGAYPGESLDIFDYLFRGRMMVEYGASPLATAPIAFNSRPFYEYLTWRGQVDTYGPLWEYASAMAAWAVHYVAGRADSQVAYIFSYRLLAITLTSLCGALVRAIVRHSAPQYAVAALVAWLWNPLVLISTAIGAHNDSLMVLAILVAFWLLQRQRWVWGLLAFVLAAHVKLTALLILPLVGLWLLRRCGWIRCIRIGALTLAIALPLSWLLYAPLGGWVTLRRMLQERARLLINSPADLVYRLLQARYGWSEPDAWRTATLGATLLFFAIAAGVLIWFWLADQGRRTKDQVTGHSSLVFGPVPKHDALLWRTSAALTLTYLLIGSFWFQHWYLLWLLAPVVLLPASRWALTLLPIYCLGALWSDLTNSFLRVVPGHSFAATQIDALNVLAQVTPLLLVLLVAQIWQARSRVLAAVRSRLPLRIRPATASPQYEMDDRS